MQVQVFAGAYQVGQPLAVGRPYRVRLRGFGTGESLGIFPVGVNDPDISASARGSKGYPAAIGGPARSAGHADGQLHALAVPEQDRGIGTFFEMASVVVRQLDGLSAGQIHHPDFLVLAFIEVPIGQVGDVARQTRRPGRGLRSRGFDAGFSDSVVGPILYCGEPVLQFGQALFAADGLDADGRQIGVQTAHPDVDPFGSFSQTGIDHTEGVIARRNRGLVFALVVRCQVEDQHRKIAGLQLHAPRLRVLVGVLPQRRAFHLAQSGIGRENDRVAQGLRGASVLLAGYAAPAHPREGAVRVPICNDDVHAQGQSGFEPGFSTAPAGDVEFPFVDVAVFVARPGDFAVLVAVLGIGHVHPAHRNLRVGLVPVRHFDINLAAVLRIPGVCRVDHDRFVSHLNGHVDRVFFEAVADAEPGFVVCGVFGCFGPVGRGVHRIAHEILGPVRKIAVDDDSAQRFRKADGSGVGHGAIGGHREQDREHPAETGLLESS